MATTDSYLDGLVKSGLVPIEQAPSIRDMAIAFGRRTSMESEYAEEHIAHLVILGRSPLEAAEHVLEQWNQVYPVRSYDELIVELKSIAK